MSLTKYRAFIHTVEVGSLTGAAKLMGYSQPALSKMIDTLEKELDITLFMRKGSSIELTDNGRQVYAYCKKVVQRDDELINAVNAMNGLLTGTVRIGAVNSMIVEYVPDLIKRYHEIYPMISIILMEMTFEEITEGIKNGSLDIGFASEWKQDDVEFISLITDEICLIVNEKSPLANTDTISVEQLEQVDLIVNPGGWNDLFLEVQSRHRLSQKGNLIVGSDDGAIRLVENGAGAYIISASQCRNLPQKVMKKSFEERIFKEKGLVVKSRKKTSPAIREMIRIAKEKI